MQNYTNNFIGQLEQAQNELVSQLNQLKQLKNQYQGQTLAPQVNQSQPNHAQAQPIPAEEPNQVPKLNTTEEIASAYFKEILSKNKYFSTFLDKVYGIKENEMLESYILFLEVLEEEQKEIKESKKDKIRKALKPKKEEATQKQAPLVEDKKPKKSMPKLEKEGEINV